MLSARRPQLAREVEGLLLGGALEDHLAVTHNHESRVAQIGAVQCLAFRAQDACSTATLQHQQPVSKKGHYMLCLQTRQDTV